MGLVLGLIGGLVSLIPASAEGSVLPFRTLHRTQAQTMFSQSVRAPPAPGHDVVEREFAGREALAAILAAVAVAGEDVPAVELDRWSGGAGHKSEADDPRNLDLEVDRSGSSRRPGSLKRAGLGDLAPALEVVREVAAVVEW